ncbi:hypothetical protein F2Q69_00052895 [Brassica cretica]|uniref:Uncharacterized protein n=1 Tax=Brassica cretica TaxID=69181 RepID=A0A8S9N4Y3_BRACR|nr:hypothetical protein F2Q69_00052895 [Brassica cretica]
MTKIDRQITLGHSFNNTSPPSIDRVHSASVDTHPHPAKRSYASIDTIPGTSIDIKAAAFEKEKGNIPIPSREDIADILQVANGPDNLFMQQRSISDNIPTVLDEHPGASTTAIGSHQSYRPVGHASINKVAPTSFDRVTPTSLENAPSPSIDRRYEFRHRAYDIYGARKFRWEQKDEYGVYRDEFGYARSVAGEMIPVTKENIRKILERASLYEESHICLPEHATSFTHTRLVPEIYTKDEINEMVTCICGAQERLGDELKTLHSLEKEATTSPSIDANKATLIDVKPQTSQQDLDTIRKKDPQPATSIDICNITSIDSKFAAMEDRLQSYEDMHDRFTSPIMRYLDSLSTQMMKVQKDIGKLNDQHDFQEEGPTSIDRFRWTSLDGEKPTEHLPYTASEVDQITSKLYTAIDTMEERLEKRCDDIYFPFDSVD